tara:strand:+ start:97 stop:681 length:585 start_codon:yes stop_codon:yes gene_type:complete
MSAALLGLVLICCSSSAAGAGTFLGGFIPDTSPFIAKKLKKIIQLIITGDAKPIDCANLYKYMKEIKGKPAAESAVQSLSENEKIIGERVYDIGREGVSPEKICDKRVVDLAIEFFKKIQKAPEGEDVTGFCSELSELNNDNANKPRLAYYWDESKKEFVEDDIYFSNAFGGKSGPELQEPVIAKCEAAGINIR